MKGKPLVRGILALLLGVLLAGGARAETLRVFAAASLTEAFGEIGKAFEASHPGLTVEFNFAGSQVLRTQLEQGAEADVFASADRSHAESLKAGKLLPAYAIFTRNVPVVVVPVSGSPVTNLVDLARPGVTVVVAGPTVPVGRYTTQVLRNMAASGLYGDDYQTRVQANTVSQESSVRAVLSKVVLGEVDAGFVYRTDALTVPGKVRVLTIPDRLNVIAEYPIGVVAGSHAAGLAREFIAFVTGAGGRAILDARGFLP